MPGNRGDAAGTGKLGVPCRRRRSEAAIHATCFVNRRVTPPPARLGLRR
ncbi:MAG: hypothetical protein QM811_31795 [Pirellulales bacterium]